MNFGNYNLDNEKELNLYGYTKIGVVANFRKDGKFVPIKAQIVENEERITIDLIVSRITEQKDRIAFDCYYERGNIKHPITIFYFIKQHTWMIRNPLGKTLGGFFNSIFQSA